MEGNVHWETVWDTVLRNLDSGPVFETGFEEVLTQDPNKTNFANARARNDSSTEPINKIKAMSPGHGEEVGIHVWGTHFFFFWQAYLVTSCLPHQTVDFINAVIMLILPTILVPELNIIVDGVCMCVLKFWMTKSPEEGHQTLCGQEIQGKGYLS